MNIFQINAYNFFSPRVKSFSSHYLLKKMQNFLIKKDNL